MKDGLKTQSLTSTTTAHPVNRVNYSKLEAPNGYLSVDSRTEPDHMPLVGSEMSSLVYTSVSLDPLSSKFAK